MTELVKKIADELEEEIKTEDFEGLSDMMRCYQMDSDDLKSEIESIINASKLGYMCDDEVNVYSEEDAVEYKKIVSAVRKELKTRGLK